MCKDEKRDRRDAIPSWNGYIYQGEIAIVAVLEVMIKMKNNPVKLETYSMALEDIEDFSIYEDDKLRSIHQVKAKRHVSPGDYDEAVFFLAKATEENAETIAKAYLHVEEEYKSKLNVENSIKNYKDKKLHSWKLALNVNNKDAQREAFEILKKAVTQKGDISKKASLDKRAILQKIESKYLIKLSWELVCIAIQKYVDEISCLSFKTDSNKKIELYKYSSQVEFLDSEEVLERIQKLIFKWWGDNAVHHTAESCKAYMRMLQELVTLHVKKCSNNVKYDKKLEFTKFKELLDSSLPSDGELRLLDQKEVLYSYQKEYCQTCKDKNECITCEVDQIMNQLLLFSTQEFKKAAYLLLPDKNIDIDENAVNLFEKYGVKFCLLKTLKKAYGSNLFQYKILYQIDDIFMLTALYLGDDEVAGDSVSCMAQNKIIDKFYKDDVEESTVEDFCRKINSNEKMAMQRMDINGLIVKHSIVGEEVIDSIDEYLIKHTKVPGDSKLPPSYMKITNNGKLSLVSVDYFLNHYFGGNKNE